MKYQSSSYKPNRVKCRKLANQLTARMRTGPNHLRGARGKLDSPFPEVHVREAPVPQSENDGRVESAHLIDPLRDFEELHLGEALRLQAGAARALALRSPTGGREMLDVVNAHRVAQNL